MSVVGVQIRMARAALSWGVKDLAKAAGVTPNTVSRYENGGNAFTGSVDKMQAALEAAGVEFIPAYGDSGPGVRLKSRRRQKAN